MHFPISLLAIVGTIQYFLALGTSLEWVGQEGFEFLAFCAATGLDSVDLGISIERR